MSFDLGFVYCRSSGFHSLNSTVISNVVPKISGQRSWDHVLGNVALQRLSVSAFKFKGQIEVSNFIKITLSLYLIIHVLTY